MQKRSKPSFDQYPLFAPESDWEPPTELPDLSQETEIAIDTETRDPMLKINEGPGFYKYERGNHNTGFIAGISAAWRNHSIYIPLRHDYTNYLDQDLVRRWLKSLAAQDHTRFVFHNFGYDWGWIQAQFDIPPPKLLDDVSAMASMIDENLFSFKLDDLCHWWGLPGKNEELLNEAAANYGIVEKEVKQYLWQLPAKFVAPYGAQDAVSTKDLAGRLRPILAEENLEAAYQVERDLMPITLRMKQRGIRVDKQRAEELSDKILDHCNDELSQLSSHLGETVTIKEIRANRWLKAKFDKMGLTHPWTPATANYPKGQPSFDKVFMANHQDPFPRAVQRIRHQTDLAEKFLQKFILHYSYKGRVHPTINQFRSEEGGARSHRFSYADPPLQQMPSRDDEFAPLIRSCFLPEEGEDWYSIDYRQQEYRLIVFVAELLRKVGASRAADMYRQDPSTDFHDYVAGLTRLPRRRAKDVNFAKSYGAGIPKFASMTGMDLIEAADTMEQYDEELPFVKQASDHYGRFAANNGYIKLIDGARNHFNLYEPAYRNMSYEAAWRKNTPYKIIQEFEQWKGNRASVSATAPCHEEEYERRRSDSRHPWYGERGKRSFTHKAFNRMIQGSAARQIKKAMVDIDRAGYEMLLQLHDELGFSFANREHALACAKLMEEAMPVITLPMLTDTKVGHNWGQLEKIIP